MIEIIGFDATKVSLKREVVVENGNSILLNDRLSIRRADGVAGCEATLFRSSKITRGERKLLFLDEKVPNALFLGFVPNMRTGFIADVGDDDFIAVLQSFQGKCSV